MTRKLLTGFAIFLSLFAAILYVSHRYLIQRLVLEPGWPEAITWGLTAFFWAGAATQLLMPFAVRFLPPATGRFIAWPGYTWLGALFYFLVLTGLSDVSLWLTGLHGQEISRMRSLAIVAGTGLVTLVGMVEALRLPQVRRLEVPLPRWPAALNGYRVVQISDIHIGAILQRRFAERLTEACNALSPDLLAITGDLVDGSLEHLQEHVAPFAELRAADGVFFVTGNHDHYAGAKTWSHYLEDLGMRVLRNSHAMVEREGATFCVGGVHDRTSSAGDDVQAAFDGVAEDTPRLLLAHHPQTFPKATHYGVDLQLSGHTHAGQMWPFRYLVNLQTRFIDGLHRLGPHALYVSRGTGFWGPPLRVLAPAEITELILVRAG